MPSEDPYLGQGCTTPYAAGEVARRLCWAAVQSTLFRWSPRPFHGFRARLLKLFGADIAEPGEVVDLAPRASVNAGSDADHAQISRTASA